MIRRISAAVGSAVMAAVLFPTPAPAAAHDVTDPLEAARVDRVPAPALDWRACPEGLAQPALLVECARTALPLDYDEPDGPTTPIALLRVPAADPTQRLGTLFVNAGGPGGPTRLMALHLAVAASDESLPFLRGLRRFDIVGMDPRGVGGSAELRCHTSAAEGEAARRGVPMVPVDADGRAAALRFARSYAASCARHAGPLAAAMSTAQVARDLDVLRRAVGDDRLTYFSGSYGSILGQYYANMFPDRVRALAVDGVIDARDWRGTRGNRERPVFSRVRSGEASDTAGKELMRRCAHVGAGRCAFAAGGDPRRKYDQLATRLRQGPVPVVVDGEPVPVTYEMWLAVLNLALRLPAGQEAATALAQDLWLAAFGGDRRRVLDLTGVPEPLRRALRGEDVWYPQLNLDAFTAVVCSDTARLRPTASWVAAGEREDRRHPGFGPMWSWLDAPCGAESWAFVDEDRYVGRFDKVTSAPVLVVGADWDPATHGANTRAVADLLPASHELTRDGWGHSASFVTPCAGKVIVDYLVSVGRPETSRCRGEVQPYQDRGAAGAVPLVPNLW